ncbi:MFS transporter [Lactiplantibacillus sp. WILCCON 0030]|uniref:MFS transporter n=1 Tax=Lactiplantibacillus brownii TaxID=3069269 RepID=A0ABU1A9Z8_9LACO|nr:MFS transporter [Lactiplantibacillus brownii]MDQ7937752.1 MFS transporter [Lactiplantibacillus brownii]
MLKTMQHNLHQSYLYTAFAYFGIAGLWVMFLQERGLSLVQIGLCESIYHLTSLLFQVPAGALADRFSYRTMLIASRIAAVGHASIMLLAPVHSFWWFASAFILLGWASSLQSGTLETLLFETLVDGQQSKHYPQVISVMNTILKVAGMTGLILAGWLIHDFTLVTYQLYLVAAIGALIAAITLHEPSRHTPNGQPLTLRQIARAAITGLHKLPQLAYLMIFNTIFSVIGAAYYNYFQAVLAAHGFKGGLLSGILVVVTVLNVISVQLTPYLQRYWSPVKLLTGLATLLIFTLLLTGTNQLPIMLGGYFFVNMLMAGIAPIMTSYYNNLIASGQRATLLSVSSMLYSLTTSLAFPLIGWLIEHHSFAVSFTWIGSGLAVLGLLSLGLLVKTNHS